MAHRGLPAFDGRAGCHYLQVTLKILDLHISEKLRVAQVDGIVLAPRALEVCQELWPDLPVTQAIFFLGTGLDPHHKSNALHRTAPPRVVLRLFPLDREDMQRSGPLYMPPRIMANQPRS